MHMAASSFSCYRMRIEQRRELKSMKEARNSVRGCQPNDQERDDPWAKSGLAAHKEQCDATINWEDVEILSKIKCKSKKQLPYKLDYMESLNIKLHKTGPGNGFNEDEGRRFFTKQWDPLLADLRKKMELE